MEDSTALVRETARYVCAQAQDVSIDPEGVERLAAVLEGEAAALAAPRYDRELHFWEPAAPEAVAQYLLVLDAANFCFWPDGELEYAQLAGGLRDALRADPRCLDAPRLAALDGPGLRALLRWPRPLPLEAERARLLREVGGALARLYGGLAANLARAAGGSAARLVALTAAAFPGFRDHCVLGGRQLFFYKRAQIWAADLWGAFGGEGLGAFGDIGALTMFADYRVPAVLRELGVLRYAPGLAYAVDGRRELAAGGRQEVEIRAATVEAVERLRAALGARLRHSGRADAAAALCSVALDWWLWERGEAQRHTHRPHHRTLTIFY